MWFPEVCGACGAPGPSPCARCARRLRPAPALPPPAGLDALAALLRYDDTARRLIGAVKFSRARASVVPLASAAAGLVEQGDGAPRLVTWAPTTARRRRERGFDQAELVARVVGSRLGLQVRGTLRRRGDAHQTGRSRAERLVGPQVGAVAAVPPSVLVVDDVCTTGATLSAAAAALRAAGATRVDGLVLARTPPRSGPGGERSGPGRSRAVTAGAERRGPGHR